MNRDTRAKLLRRAAARADLPPIRFDDLWCALKCPGSITLPHRQEIELTAGASGTLEKLVAARYVHQYAAQGPDKAKTELDRAGPKLRKRLRSLRKLRLPKEAEPGLVLGYDPSADEVKKLHHFNDTGTAFAGTVEAFWASPALYKGDEGKLRTSGTLSVALVVTSRLPIDRDPLCLASAALAWVWAQAQKVELVVIRCSDSPLTIKRAVFGASHLLAVWEQLLTAYARFEQHRQLAARKGKARFSPGHHCLSCVHAWSCASRVAWLRQLLEAPAGGPLTHEEARQGAERLVSLEHVAQQLHGVLAHYVAEHNVELELSDGRRWGWPAGQKTAGIVEDDEG